MLFDTFISEENDGVIFVFEKSRKNLLFFHTNKIVFIENKKNYI